MIFALDASILLLPQCWAVLTRRAAALRVFLLALSLAIATASSILIPPPVTLTTSANNAYYVVTHTYYLASYVTPVTVLSALLWAAARWASPLPRVALPLATLLAIAVSLSVLQVFLRQSGWWTPRRYIDYPDAIARLAVINGLAELAFLLVYASLVALAIYRLLRRLNDWSKST